MGIVPKGNAPDNVRRLSDARGRGKPSGLGYDPATGQEHASSTYKETATRESAAEYDVFSLVEERGYRPDRFYTRSLNADGHGERMQVRVPQGIDSQIYAAVAEVGQYRSPQDFWRDAAIHRLEWLQKQYNIDDGLRRMLELERFQADSERRALEVEVLTATVSDIHNKLEAHFVAEDWQMFGKELEESEDRAEWLRDPYKTKAEKIIKEWKDRGREQLRAMRAREK